MYSSDGTFQDLPMIAGHEQSSAWSINADGKIAGYTYYDLGTSFNPRKQALPVRWDLTELSPGISYGDRGNKFRMRQIKSVRNKSLIGRMQSPYGPATMVNGRFVAVASPAQSRPLADPRTCFCNRQQQSAQRILVRCHHSACSQPTSGPLAARDMPNAGRAGILWVSAGGMGVFAGGRAPLIGRELQPTGGAT